MNRKFLLTVKNVRVKIPTPRSVYLVVMKKVEFDDNDDKHVVVPQHFRHGQMLNHGVIINRHFYDITEDDLGKSVCANVGCTKRQPIFRPVN